MGRHVWNGSSQGNHSVLPVNPQLQHVLATRNGERMNLASNFWAAPCSSPGIDFQGTHRHLMEISTAPWSWLDRVFSKSPASGQAKDLHVIDSLSVPLPCLYPLRLCPPGGLEMLMSFEYLFQVPALVEKTGIWLRDFICVQKNSTWAEPGKFLSGAQGPCRFSASDTFGAADLGIWGLVSSNSGFTAFVNCLGNASNPLVQVHHLLSQL